MRFVLSHLFLSFGPLVAFAHFETISFSPVRQCGNFTVSFAGGKLPSSLPLALTVVPFNGTPLSIEIPDADWNSTSLTGAAITFLPFAAGTDFVASLDDANGNSAAQISEVISVDASDDTSCLSATAVTAQRYTADNSPLQCEPFNVHFDPGVVSTPPTIRAFVPKNISTSVNLTSSADVSSGQASYTMDLPEGDQVVLMFSDETGFRQSSGLLVVAGSSQNPTNCLPTTSVELASASASGTTGATASTGSKSSPSKTAAIIIGVVTGCVVGAIAIAMALWLNRERKRAALGSLKMLEESDGTRRGSRWQNWRNDINGGGERQPTRKIMTLSLPKRQGTARKNSVRANPPYTEDVKFELVTPGSAAKPTADPDVQQDATGSTPLSSIPVPLTTPLPLITEPPIANDVDARTGRRQVDPSALLSFAEIETILDTARLYNDSDTSLGVSGEQSGTRSSSKPSPSIVTAASSTALPKPPTPLLLTPPHSAETYREPPQAPLPSSALPSPAGDDSFRIMSMTSTDTRLGAQDSARMSRGLSGFSFFGARQERSSNADSFLAM